MAGRHTGAEAFDAPPHWRRGCHSAVMHRPLAPRLFTAKTRAAALALRLSQCIYAPPTGAEAFTVPRWRHVFRSNAKGCHTEYGSNNAAALVPRLVPRFEGPS